MRPRFSGLLTALCVAAAAPSGYSVRAAADKAKDKPEVVMQPGMRIEATNRVGTIAIVANDEYIRSYEWEGAVRSAELWPRSERWYGSLGLYFPGPGSHWENHHGISRGVLEEGQQHFKSKEEALKWLKARTFMDYVYRDDGLVVGWDKDLSREQLNVEVWQLDVNGKKLDHLAGSTNDKIKVTHVAIEVSPLVQAVKKDDLKATIALLGQGADPNSKDSVGNPLVVIATKRGCDPIVKALVGRKANLDARDLEGGSALMSANSVTVMRTLIDGGADVNARVRQKNLLTGATPLMLAITRGDVDCVKLLLAKGADINVKTDFGLTALDFADVDHQQEVIKLLKSAGAKR